MRQRFGIHQASEKSPRSVQSAIAMGPEAMVSTSETGHAYVKRAG
ncbi:hypothetical protein [Microbispora hainanensis]|nr:hypothetical protein [Microbispora hainanensis]